MEVFEFRDGFLFCESTKLLGRQAARFLAFLLLDRFRQDVNYLGTGGDFVISGLSRGGGSSSFRWQEVRRFTDEWNTALRQQRASAAPQSHSLFSSRDIANEVGQIWINEPSVGYSHTDSKTKTSGAPRDGEVSKKYLAALSTVKIGGALHELSGLFKSDGKPLTSSSLIRIIGNGFNDSSRFSQALISLVNVDVPYHFLRSLQSHRIYLSVSRQGLSAGYAFSTFPRKFVIDLIQGLDPGSSTAESSKIAKAQFIESLDRWHENLNQLASEGEYGLTQVQALQLFDAAFSSNAGKVEPIANSLFPFLKPSLVELRQVTPHVHVEFATCLLSSKVYRRVGRNETSSRQLQLIDDGLAVAPRGLWLRSLIEQQKLLEECWVRYIRARDGGEYGKIISDLHSMSPIVRDKRSVSITTMAELELSSNSFSDSRNESDRYTLLGLCYHKLAEECAPASTAAYSVRMIHAELCAELSICFFARAKEIGFFSADFDGLVDSLAPAGFAVFNLGRLGLLEAVLGPLSTSFSTVTEKSIGLLALAHYTQRVLAFGTERSFVLIYLASVVIEGSNGASHLQKLTFNSKPVTVQSLFDEICRNSKAQDLLHQSLDTPSASGPDFRLKLAGTRVGLHLIRSSTNSANNNEVFLQCKTWLAGLINHIEAEKQSDSPPSKQFFDLERGVLEAKALADEIEKARSTN